ncbi:NUDIX hydrolase [bacterium]|nr:NUDIX hydrolase [bacterium]
MEPTWIDWIKRLQAIAQTGLTYSENPFDRERYESIRRIAAEIAAISDGLNPSAVETMFSRDDGYATPKIDVRGVVFRGDEILMVREVLDGLWTMPGGWADVCSTPAENVEREVFEESGFRVRAVKLLAVYDRSRHGHPPIPWHVYKMFFLCELLGGEAKPSNETSEVGFFAEDALPELSLTRLMPDEVARMFEHHRNPGLTTDFE